MSDKIHGRTPHRRRNRDAAQWKVLVIEDQRSLAEIQARLYEERVGCQVEIAASFDEVQALLAQKQRYELVCSDLIMPGSPNGEVVELCLDAGLPTIAVTGAFGGDMRERLLHKGVLDYVLKSTPNSYQYIADQINRLHNNRHTKVLVVDDDDFVRKNVAHALSRQFLTVLTAANGRGALKAIEEHSDVRLVITDHLLPGMTGVDLTLALRRQFGKDRMAIIGISSSSEHLLAAQFLKSGASDYMAKPFSFEELICRVNQNLNMLELIESNRRAAYSDVLTGLPNRRHFFEFAATALQECQRQRRWASLAILDVDHFKRINDTWGHDVGDEALELLGDVMLDCFPNQHVARIGGEEFAIVLPGSEQSQAQSALERFRRALASAPLQVQEHHHPITVSIGVVSRQNGTVDSLIRAADRCLYQAKERGRNCIEVG